MIEPKFWTLSPLSTVCSSKLFSQRRLCCGETRDRDTEGTATDVIQTEPVAELHALGIAAVFAANAELDLGATLSAFVDGNLHELADAGLIERRERVLLEDLVLDVRHEEVAHVVAADSERHLGEIVRAEAEELGALRDFIGSERAARHFDHGADQIIEFHFLLRHHLLRNAMDDLGLKIELFLEADERDH